MSWKEIIANVSFADTEPLSDALIEAGALSITVEDADEGTDREKPMFDEPGADDVNYAWENSIVKALVESDADIEKIIKTASDACGLAELPTYTVRDVPDEDWVRLTQSQFAPIHIGKNIWIVPSWHEVPNDGSIVLELDPGLAFGTGSHPTTHLCLEWIEAEANANTSLLDYGCGSGILAITAAKLGATDIDGVDIDPQSIISTNDNCERNNVHVNAFLPDEYEDKIGQKQYDIVIANILAGPLQTLVETLVKRLKKQGRLVLSGILESQASTVIEAYAPYISLSVWKTMDGWVALSGKLNS